jgi:hypothetical protein
VPAVASGRPVAVAYSPEAVWALLAGETPSLARIDPASGEEAAARVPLPIDAARLAVSSADGVWLGGNDRVFQIDPESGVAATTIALTGVPERLLLAHGALLVLVSHPGATGQLESLDPASGATRWAADVGPGPVALTTWRGNVWVADRVSHDLRSFDEATGLPGRVERLPGDAAASAPVELSATRDGLIVCLTDQVLLQPVEGRLDRRIALGALRAIAFAASPSASWILATAPGDPAPALYRIAGTVGPATRLGGSAVAIATGGGQVWVANQGLASVTRVPERG